MTVKFIKFDSVVCRRIIFQNKELATAFHKYRSPEDTYGEAAAKKVFALHIMPYSFRVDLYDEEFKKDYPEHTADSLKIATLVEEMGWKGFLRALCLYVKKRSQLMPLLYGSKKLGYKAIEDKIMSMRTILK